MMLLRHLTVGLGLRVGIVDPNPPLSFTSAYSTECYRDAWGSDPMQKLMRRSISLMEERAIRSQNTFMMNRNGYLFLSTECSPDELSKGMPSSWGLRTNGYESNQPGTSPDPACNFLSNPDGMDVMSSEQIRGTFPFIGDRVQSAVHARRCGWMDAQQMGMSALLDAKETGLVEIISGTVVRVQTDEKDNAVSGVVVNTSGSDTFDIVEISTPVFVNAAGPYCQDVHFLVGSNSNSNSNLSANDLFSGLGMRNLLHSKVLLRDTLGVVPINTNKVSDIPMIISADPIRLPWTSEELEAFGLTEEIAADAADRALDADSLEDVLGSPAWANSHRMALPAGAHFRPSNSGTLLFVWEHAHHHLSAVSSNTNHMSSSHTNSNSQARASHSMLLAQLGNKSNGGISGDDFYSEMVESRLDPLYPEMVIRAMSTIVPGLKEYVDRGLSAGNVVMDGGYYTQTADLKPVIGPVKDVPGYHLLSAFAGFGVMAAEGAGELCAAYIDGANVSDSSLPDYAQAFLPDRQLVMQSQEHLSASNTKGGGIGNSL